MLTAAALLAVAAVSLVLQWRRRRGNFTGEADPTAMGGATRASPVPRRLPALPALLVHPSLPRSPSQPAWSRPPRRRPPPPAPEPGPPHGPDRPRPRRRPARATLGQTWTPKWPRRSPVRLPSPWAPVVDDTPELPSPARPAPTTSEDPGGVPRAGVPRRLRPRHERDRPQRPRPGRRRPTGPRRRRTGRSPVAPPPGGWPIRRRDGQG